MVLARVDLRGGHRRGARIALRGGGWWTHGISQGFFKDPTEYFKDERVKDLIIDNLGSAAQIYHRQYTQPDK